MMLCVISFVEIGLVVNDNDNEHNDLQRTNFDQKNSLEPSTPVS